MKNYVLPKLIGLVILTMMALIILSFLEVAVYSYLVNPDQEQSVYESHANSSAPYISAIFGFVIFFLVARYWKKRAYPNALRLSLLFPLLYLMLDILIITAAGVNWSDFFLIFAIANASKFAGSFSGYSSIRAA